MDLAFDNLKKVARFIEKWEGFRLFKEAEHVKVRYTNCIVISKGTQVFIDLYLRVIVYLFLTPLQEQDPKYI